jgi:hypothetical protein
MRKNNPANKVAYKNKTMSENPDPISYLREKKKEDILRRKLVEVPNEVEESIMLRRWAFPPNKQMRQP